MAEDICASPQITRLSLGLRQGETVGRVGYQINDSRGGYVVLEDDDAEAAAFAVIADLYLRRCLRRRAESRPTSPAGTNP